MSDGQRGGVSVPGYDIERELGRGGFAVVYRANQPKLRRTVALKVLTNVDPSDDDAKRRFEAECQAIGSLSWHPHVVTVYDAGATEEGLPFLAMEHLPSGSLQAKLGDHGRAPWEEVLRVAVQMCDALGAAHQAGILHRDIKPANVLTSRIGDYKLADFGIARFGDSQRTATGVITGTVAYTAPEVLRGARASAASDLYALGAMLCAVASGRTPFVKDADESVVAIMYRVNTEDPPPLAEFDVPEDVALLIHTLMDKDPEKRPASALEVAAWAQHLQEQRGIQAVPLHTDPDMTPGLPPAAIAAGAAALGAAATSASAAESTVAAGTWAPAGPTPPPPSDPYSQGGYPGTPAPPGYPAPTPPPQPAYTPAPASTTYGAPAYAQTGAYNPQTGTYDGGTGAYGPQSGAYSAPGGGSGSSNNGGKILLIVGAVAAAFVILIILIAFLASGGDSNASDTTTTEARSSTTEASSTTDEETTTTEEATTTTEEATTTTEEATTTTEAGPGTPYPSAVRDPFINSCVGSGATEDYCTCVIDGIEDIYTLDEFEDFALGPAGMDPTAFPPEIQAIVTRCVG